MCEINEFLTYLTAGGANAGFYIHSLCGTGVDVNIDVNIDYPVWTLFGPCRIASGCKLGELGS